MRISFLVSLLLFTQSLWAVDYEKIINDYTEETREKIQTPGMIVAIVKDGEVVHHKAFGKRNVEENLPVERDTIFRIGSLSKTFTATAVMILREEGKLRLDDLVENYIEELKEIQYPYPNSPKITLRHLLTHSSGLIRHPNPENQTIEGLIQEVLHPSRGSSFIQSFDGSYWYPGFQYEYSNVGIALLGEVVARVSGMSVRDYIMEKIAKPLGMKGTYWHESELPEEKRSYGYSLDNGDWKRAEDWDLMGYSAAGSIYSTIDDLAKWMKLQFQTNPNETSELLTPFAIHELHRIQAVDPSGSIEGVGLVWYTLGKDGQNQVGHNGATMSYLCNFAFDSDHNVGIITLSASREFAAEKWSSDLFLKIQKALDMEESQSYGPFVERLLSYLKLEKKTGFDEIFVGDLYNYAGSDERWVTVLEGINQKYGVALDLLSIEVLNTRMIRIRIKTTQGVLAYRMTFENNEKKKLIGFSTNGFERD